MRSSTPKLTDCAKPGSGSELFIVEGDSAAEAVKNVRNPATQAVLPMQGKPMNAMKATACELSENVQFAALLDALGGGQVDALHADTLRYERYILLLDPDADGIHSGTLMLLFFYRWLPELLDAGRVFDAHAPLWEVSAEGLQGAAYAKSATHLEKVRSYLQENGAGEIKAKRFRGLANVPAPIIGTHCVHPATRQLRPLSRHDATTAIDVFQQMRDLEI